MKGSKEAVQVAAATSLPLVHVGGGEVDEMQRQAATFGADLIIMPRIDEIEIVALMRNAHALIATARTDGFNGRRLSWPDTEEGLAEWVKAVEQAGDEANQVAWSKAGRERILERFTANHQAEGLARSLAAMDVDVETTDLEMLPGLDPA